MSLENAAPVRSARVIVVGNEKGGSGKSTIAMHVAVALMKLNGRVATIDLDSRQKTFTHYIENRYDWSQHIARDLEIPHHIYFVENMDHPTAEDETADGDALTQQIEALACGYDFVVIDTPGRNSHLGRLVLAMADTVVTPLNDSFVDLDVLGTVEPKTLAVTGASHYAQVVEEARRQRQLRDNIRMDWIVLKNRLSMLGSRNTRVIDQRLKELSQRLDFRCVEGVAERVIFREFYPRGLTVFEALDEAILGVRPTSSHVTARLEIENLVNAIASRGGTAEDKMVGQSCDAA